jgi:tRNA-dihydrouridine synthase B
MLQLLKLGKLTLSSPVLCAPLAGCTDFPFRQVMLPFRPGLIYCEMVKIEALVRKNAKTCRYLDYTPQMHPIGAQICGSHAQVAKEAARIVEDLGFDVIDLNCGCPVDKIVKDGSGSGLLRAPEQIGEIVAAIVAAVQIPVTVKIRSGWDRNQITAPSITRIAEEAGASAITIHGRTREQAYSGQADWNVIHECKKVANNILVIGNGDVIDGPSAARMLAVTHCDAVLVARGMLGRPWIVEDIERYLAGSPPLLRGIADTQRALFDHFDKIIQYQPEQQALLDMRRVGCWYLKHYVGAKFLRMQINQARSTSEIFAILGAFDWNLGAVKQ